jgi:hypothetical protein
MTPPDPQLSSPDSALPTGPGPVSLSANPRLPLLVLLISVALLPLPLAPWPTLVVALFGFFLLLQAYSLRLEFCTDTLVVWRGSQELRRFPYQDWLSWRLFAPWLPGLFYFREVKSIHLLPILFDAEELKRQLQQRIGALEQPNPGASTGSTR